MVIKLENADFSANNLGQIDVSVVSQFTLDAIAAGGNKTMTAEQQSALENFFVSVGAKTNTGVWAKINKIYIPFIAADLSYALVNYKGNEKDLILSSDKYALSQGGVTGALASPSTYTAQYMNLVVGSKNISTFLMYSSIPLQSARPAFSYQGNSGDNRFSYSVGFSGGGDLRLGYNFLNPSNTQTSLNGGYISTDDVAKKLFIVSSEPTDVTTVKTLSKNGTKVTVTNANRNNIGTDTSGKIWPFANPTETPPTSSSTPMCMMGFGTSMTDEEMLLFKNACELLASKF